MTTPGDENRTNTEGRPATASTDRPITLRSNLSDPAIYVWAVHDQRGHGACGVTAEPARAADRLSEALYALPLGAKGSIRLAHLDCLARRPSYAYRAVLMYVERDEVTGILMCHHADAHLDADAVERRP